MNVSAVGLSGHSNLLIVPAFCLPMLPGAIAWELLPGEGEEPDSPRSGYAGQKFQQSQPEELAMLAILFLQKNVGIVGNRRAPT